MKQETSSIKRWASSMRHFDDHVAARSRSSALTVRWLLVALVLVGVGLRLWLIAINPIDPASSTADDGDYYRRALRLAITGQYIDGGWLIRPPFHIFFFAIWLRIGVLFGNFELGVLLVKLAQTALSVLSMLLGFALARRLFANQWAGLLFALFLVLWFPFVEQPSVLFSELLYITLFLTHFWLLVRFDQHERRRDLALSGLALGAAALTRSPALYSLAFVVLWLVVREYQKKNKEQRTNSKATLASIKHQASSIKHSLFIVLRQSAFVIVCCLAVVLPWTARNYVVYQQFIPIDTLGQTNLWLDLDKVDQRAANQQTLRGIPQAERQAFVMARVREILAADPWRPFRQMWPTFQHIWKAQFVEDYFVKESFYDRPLRAAAPLGLFGDVLWLVFTAAGLVGLAAPPREGWHNRLFVLAWIGYTLLTVLIFHVEPRYLLPLWLMIGLYGAGVLGGAVAKNQEPRTAEPQNRRTAEPQNREPKKLTRSPAHLLTHPSSVLQLALLVAFAALLVTYRDYPAIIRQGMARERSMRAGDSAFARGDYVAAEQEYRAASAAQPSFLDSKVRLALAQIAQGRNAEAQATVSGVNLRTAQFVSELAAPGGGAAKVAALNDVEATIGLDIQRWTLRWLRPRPTSAVHLGDGTDLGYIAGFSAAETDATSSFRWLGNAGKVVLPLPAPLQPGATLSLRVVAPHATTLTVGMGEQRATIAITPGQWRKYVLLVPRALAGQPSLTVDLSAPTFIPLYQNPTSDDMRQLSVMISDVWVK